MTIKSIYGKFAFHVDPVHYGFQWTEAMYITVDYTAIKQGNDVVASVYSIAAVPWLMTSIVMRNNWMTVDKEITAAAQDHAEKEFGRNGQVNPTILQALAPHI
jgi:hypothetical protein